MLKHLLLLLLFVLPHNLLSVVPSLTKTIKKILSEVPVAQSNDYLMGWYEWNELDIDEYIRTFDRTHTLCGLWGLEQLTKPITNYTVIQERQAAIAQLATADASWYQLCKLLDDIKQHQHSVLDYYDETNELNIRVQQLYYTSFASFLNSSKMALDYAYITDMGISAANLASLLCLHGLVAEFVRAQVEGRPINVFDGVSKGLFHLISMHSPGSSHYQALKKQHKFDVIGNCADVQLSHDATMFGSLSNIFNTLSYKVRHGLQYGWRLITNPATIDIATQGSLGDKNSFYQEQLSIPPGISAVFAAAQLLYLDQSFYMRARQNYRRLVFLFNTYTALQHRMVHLAKLMQAMQELVEIAQTIPALAHHDVIRKAHQQLNCPESSLHRLAEQLSGYTEQKIFFYSRGQLLITHSLIKEHKRDLIGLLQAIGLIDGFISICRVYQQHATSIDKPFCFVELLQAEQPICDFQDAWLPLMPDGHVYNSCLLGDTEPCNLLLTGPNGGGKSTFLKLVGGLAVLAHSWGIVPAMVCRMTICAGLRTSFNPQENLKQGISTFMAQKERLATLQTAVKTSDKGCFMLLIDEPYRGTIEAEAELRCYNVCKELAAYPSCMMVVASHLKKPIDLAADTKLFANKHFAIDMHSDGTFKRTFKLQDGPASWWFEDIEKRMQFIDWLQVCNSDLKGVSTL